MQDCIFCKIVRKEIPSTVIYENSNVLVFQDIHPQAPVHWIIIPKQHISEFVEADSGIMLELFDAAKKMIIDHAITGYRLVTNGKGAAYIDHLHIHVMGKIDKDRAL